MHTFSFCNNDIFRHLLELTQLNEDQNTLITLFNEQGIDICTYRIYVWSLPASHPQYKPIPAKIFSSFMNLLTSIKNETLQKEINLFDLRGILEETR
ncbi:hypothetical protein L292_2081 [Acinetobacter junii CIP 107470 = MTCC 11364]|uniref:Uncharacterized protein n=1 Tax=Acinetobacter junii CIP 107470 = MTCC 11364 TaxID=1217666 RepID=S7WXU1_ACIJU|nr:hypothetical protein [Acinetobacter junii]ENV52071.1 hypothetical protein F953_00483 [Acinetobacter junii CIP 107470 = MTCC 11364]EPR86847.1 hypothetical protein L292_2081 [Acinetobacter junii CIP 107470 = MTCC 11364]